MGTRVPHFLIISFRLCSRVLLLALEDVSFGNVKLLELVEAGEYPGPGHTPHDVDPGAPVERLRPLPRHHLLHAGPRGGVSHLKQKHLVVPMHDLTFYGIFEEIREKTHCFQQQTWPFCRIQRNILS